MYNGMFVFKTGLSISVLSIGSPNFLATSAIESVFHVITTLARLYETTSFPCTLQLRGYRYPAIDITYFDFTWNILF